MVLSVYGKSAESVRRVPDLRNGQGHEPRVEALIHLLKIDYLVQAQVGEDAVIDA